MSYIKCMHKSVRAKFAELLLILESNTSTKVATELMTFKIAKWLAEDDLDTGWGDKRKNAIRYLTKNPKATLGELSKEICSSVAYAKALRDEFREGNMQESKPNPGYVPVSKRNTEDK